MAADIDPAARVVVIPVGIGHYDPPTAPDKTRFKSLAKVESDLSRLADLFRSDPYARAGFSVLPAIGGRAGAIGEALIAIKSRLQPTPQRIVALVWSGHAEVVRTGLRLATIETASPMDPGDGMSPEEVVAKLANFGADSLCVILDTCDAGAAAGVVAETGSKLFGSPSFRGLGALFSAQSYQSAKDGLFVEHLERVLQKGPSAEAMRRITERGYGGFTFNRLLTLGELDDVMQVEFEILKETNRGIQSPVGVRVGGTFGLFPNPKFVADGAPVSVDVARRRILRDEDARLHFLPKARGLEPGEDGWFFAGRAAVSRDIRRWLGGAGPAGRDPLYVLTGAGGTGKSAIIGRMVALSDPALRKDARASGWNEQEDRAAGTIPGLGTIDAVIHARNQTAESIAATLGPFVGTETTSDLAAFVERAPTSIEGRGRPVVLVVDALDEAVRPAWVAERLIAPLVTRKGWRVLVGTRPSAGEQGSPNLIDRLGPGHQRDLSTEPLTDEDIAKYAEMRLAAPDSPYADLAPLRAEIAAAIAGRAAGRFLYARITLDGLLRRPVIERQDLATALADGVHEAFAREVSALDDVFRAEFRRDDPGATALLAALAWGEGEGLPSRDDLWTLVATAVAQGATPYGAEHQRWILREAGRYVIESGDGEQAVYRLFHESLNEHFRSQDEPAEVQSRIVAALLQKVDEGGGWALANPYIVRSVLTHAAGQDDRLEEVCTTGAFLRRGLDLLGVDGLADLLGRARRTSRRLAVEAVAKSVRSARVALTSDPGQLTAQLYARLHGETDPALGRLVADLATEGPPVWLRMRTHGSTWRAELNTTQTYRAKIRALAFGRVEATPVIAVGSGTDVHFWDPRRGAPRTWRISNDQRRVTGLAFGYVDGRAIIAVAASYDGVIVVRDVQTGAAVAEIADMHGVRFVVIGPSGPSAIPGVTSRTIGKDGSAVWCSFDDAKPLLVRDGGAVVPRIEGQARVLRDAITGKAIGTPVPHLGDVVAGGDSSGGFALSVGSRKGKVSTFLFGQEPGARILSSRFAFPIRTLVAGEIEGVPFLAAGNQTDHESGYVALRELGGEQTGPLAGAQQPAPRRLAIDGMGLVGRRLVLFVAGACIDALTLEDVASRSSDSKRVTVLSGVIEPSVGRPKPTTNGKIALNISAPLTWPMTSQRWGTLAGRTVEVRGSYRRAVWLIDRSTRKPSVLAGPFATRATGVINLGKKSGRSRGKVTSVALVEHDGRGIVAAVAEGTVALYDVRTGAALPAPDTGRSRIVAVALGTCGGRALLATGNEGGATTLWDATTAERLAAFTLETGVEDLWLAGSHLVVQTADERLHVFDVVSA